MASNPSPRLVLSHSDRLDIVCQLRLARLLMTNTLSDLLRQHSAEPKGRTRKVLACNIRGLKEVCQNNKAIIDALSDRTQVIELR